MICHVSHPLINTLHTPSIYTQTVATAAQSIRWRFKRDEGGNVLTDPVTGAPLM